MSFTLYSGAWAAPSVSNSVAIIISREIRPFIQVSEGVLDVLKTVPGVAADVHYLERIRESGSEEAPTQLVEADYAVFLTIGPEASEFIWNIPGLADTRKIYTVVLNPEKNIGVLNADQCGIPLNIPVAEQVGMIHDGLNPINRVGLIYDPEYNEDFFRSAHEAAAARGILIKPLRVSSKKNITDILQSNFSSIDALWMIPDATVISETIIQYIIKACLLQKKSVIGYNKFFYESGAAMSFVFDYYALGRQSGHMVADAVGGGSCGRQIPVFEVWLNKRVFGQLGLTLPAELPPRIKVNP